MKHITEAPDHILKMDDFGVTVNDSGVQLKVWAPCAIRVRAAIYNEGDDLFRREIPMVSNGDGTFSLQLTRGLFEQILYLYCHLGRNRL